MLPIFFVPLTLEQPLKTEPLASEQLLKTAIFKGELVDAVLEVVDVGSVGVSVDYGFVFDVHGLAGVLDGVKTLLVVGLAGADAGDHVGVGGAAQTVLQDAGQLGVAVRDELRLFLLYCQR